MSQRNTDSIRAKQLSAAKRALLAKRLRGQAPANNGANGIPVHEETGPAPLSYAQERLWFLHQLDPQSPAYNMYEVVRLQGALDKTILADAFRMLINRHPVLRSRFVVQNGRPHQHIAADVSFEIPEIKDAQDVQALVTAEIRRPFDLTQDLPLRAVLVRLAADDYVLVVTMHHIIFDEWSNELFWRELSAIYRALAADQSPDLPDLPIKYTDFTRWQRQQLDEQGAAQLDYWKQQLGGALPILQLPTDHPRPAQQTFRGALTWHALPDSLYTQLQALNQQWGTTMFMSMLAAFQLLLSRYSGQSDILVGTPIANRRHPDTKGLIGLFLNTLVMRADIDADLHFDDFVQQVRQTALDAYKHQDYPFEKLVDELRPQRDTSYNPIFQVMFVHQKSAVEEIDLPDLTVSAQPVEMGVAKFDLTLFVQESSAGLQIGLEYNTDLFTAETAQRILRHFQTLLESIVHDPQRPVVDLPYVTAVERHTLLHQWNSLTTTPVPDLCIHELIEKHAAATPQAIAVSDSDGELTYAELNGRANRLARTLRRQGVGPDVVVGLLLARSTEMVLAILAVLKAGGAYLPLDPTYPQERLAFMLQDAQAGLLLTQAHLADRTPAHDADVLIIDSDRADIAQESSANLDAAATPDNLAYIIYTSGSTGKPKGVPVAHRNLVHSTLAREEVYETAVSRFLLLSSFTFDSSIVGIFWTLCQGGHLVLPPDRIEQDMAQMAAIITRQQVTHLLCLPSLYQLLLDLTDTERLASLQTVIVAGEACSLKLVNEHNARLPATALYNEYGPTEGTVWSTVYRIPADFDGQRVPIGRPIPNMQNLILDQHDQLVPIGVPGQLHIGGAGITAGYLHRPELTAEKFTKITFDDDVTLRLYRTGDLARFLPDGNIEFLGRIDHQIKIRGNRVELGEIESVLGQIPGVKDAVVDVQDERLVAYVVCSTPLDVPAGWRAYLAERLPNYMIPSSVVTLDEFPTTPNGKLDRSALPAPQSGDQDDAFVAPSTETEQTLARIWAEVLGIERVGMHDNFFDLGGDSILSIRILAQANQEGLQLAPTDMFRHQTIAQLAAVVGRSKKVESEQHVVTGDVPLTPIQRWFFQQEQPQPDWWNQAVLLRRDEPLDVALLAQALAQLVRHHDMLRARFTRAEGTWQQTIAAEGPPPRLRTYRLPAAADPFPFIEETIADVQAAHDLSAGSLLQGAWFDGGEGGYLFLTVHHLVVDAVSWDVLLHDLETAYTQLAAGDGVSLPAKTTSFKRWAEKLAAAPAPTEEVAFWQAMSAEARPLPQDGDAAANRVGDAETETVALTAVATHALIHDVPAVYRTQINDALLTALLEAVHAWSGSDDLLLALEGHGRELLFDDVDLSRTVGWFTAVHPLRLRRTDGDLGARLRQVKEQLRAVPQNGIGYGLLRYLGDDATRRALAQAPQPQLLFNYLGRTGSEDGFFRPTPLSLTTFQGPENRRAYLIEVNAQVEQEQLVVNWTYNPAIHHPETIARLADAFIAALEQLVAWCASAAPAFTPSDFDLLPVEQAEVDRIVALLRRRTAGLKDVVDVIPLSEMQQLMLFYAQTVRGDDVLFNQLGYAIDGPLDPDAFARAWRQIIKRHAILRTAFLWQGLQTPVQVVLEQVEAPFQYIDWRGDSADVQREKYEAFLRADAARGFDPATAPLMRLTLMRMADERWRFVWSHHHLIVDRWCIGIIMHELHHLYAAYRDGRRPTLPPAPPYRDYVAWLQQQDEAEAAHFWRQMLADVSAPTVLTAQGSGSGQEETAIHLPAETAVALQQFAQQQRLTLSSVLQGALALLLSRYTDSDTVVNGVTVSGRPSQLPGISDTLGSFINNVPFRIDCPPQMTLSEWLPTVQQRQQAMQPYEHFSPVKIQGWSGIAQHKPLFELLFLFQAPIAPAEEAFAMRLVDGGLVTNYPLTLVSEVAADGTLLLAAVFDRQRFNAPYLQQFLADWQTLLTAMVADASRPLHDYRQQITPPPSTAVDPLPTAQPADSVQGEAPRSDTERTLVALWQALLQRPSVGVNDDFFALGGSSLTAMRMFSRIADEFGVTLPLSLLFTDTTIRQLAARINDEAETAVGSPLLVPIQSAGDRPPFFCIHGLTGDVLWFRQLGQLMAPDQPFYGVQARGLDAAQPAIDDIGEMAAVYLREIKEVQPTGPYFLGGASMGGTIALELARQMRESGEEVALLVMFDHAPEIEMDGPSGLGTLPQAGYHFVTNAAKWLWATREMEDGQLRQRLSRKVRVVWKRLRGDNGNEGAYGVDSSDLLDYGGELPLHRQRMIEAHWHAINHYRAAPYDGRTLLLQASVQPLISTERPEDTWIHLANGNLTVVTVPGSHESMFKMPHVKTLAHVLRTQIECAVTKVSS